HVPLAQQQQELLLGEMRINTSEGDHVEGEIPGGEPGILPLVRHRDDVAVVDMGPLGVPSLPASGRRRRLARVALEPMRRHVVIELLAPQEPGVPLTEYAPFLRCRTLGDALGVELVRLRASLLEYP